MFVSISGKHVDLNNFAWNVYEGKEIKVGSDYQYNQRHPLILRTGMLYGTKRVARGTGAGNYQVVLGTALHVLFRNVDYKEIAKLAKLSQPYTEGAPTHDQVLPSGRAKKVTIRNVATKDKMKDDLFKPAGKINETSSYDRDNYQWRKLVGSSITIKTMKQGRVKGKINKDDVFGLRYMTKARGGFIVALGDQRINIPHDTYMALVESSRILPTAQQKKGIVILSEVKALQGKQTRVRTKTIPRNTERPALQTGSGLKQNVRKTVKLIDTDIADFDYDDDEDGGMDAIGKPKMAVAPKHHSPKSVLKLGTIIQLAKTPKHQFVVLNADEIRSELVLTICNTKTFEVSKVSIDARTDMGTDRSITLLGTADMTLRAKAQRALNKAKSTNSFVEL